jgi:hypothetical protein
MRPASRTELKTVADHMSLVREHLARGFATGRDDAANVRGVATGRAAAGTRPSPRLARDSPAAR